jgi:hypothetical protein
MWTRESQRTRDGGLPTYPAGRPRPLSGQRREPAFRAMVVEAAMTSVLPPTVAQDEPSSLEAINAGASMLCWTVPMTRMSKSDREGI